MELQLGLALPIHNSTKGFDLNNVWLEPKEMVGVEPWNYKKNYVKKNKRDFEEAFGNSKHVSQTLPLLLWSGQPNDDDDHKGQNTRTSYTINKNNKEENQAVGWPPVRSWRKKSLHPHQSGCGTDKHGMRMAKTENVGGSNTMYVKVKMEGMAIARKIDLRLYHSYQTLSNSLITMFTKYKKGDKDGARYTLTYQDKDGDWLLAGDVPWQAFVECVQRLKIVKE
ncbi:AUX_IAA domain-containing protein [Cephalotus follicularis]|uniref:Auxin-responsive protein n=1 Tax=Cephalotus follicularis TaxID=3775 RepID=A0A1Q3CZV7_CEPFO|nr:AUX_IAA domain-containing protein [Cephalotus follicularis]